MSQPLPNETIRSLLSKEYVAYFNFFLITDKNNLYNLDKARKLSPTQRKFFGQRGRLVWLLLYLPWKFPTVLSNSPQSNPARLF